MSSKFFNNNTGNTLFDKLKGIVSGMANFDRFLAVVGFFRSSVFFKPNFDRFLAVVGFFRSSFFFKLRKELKDVEEI